MCIGSDSGGTHHHKTQRDDCTTVPTGGCCCATAAVLARVLVARISARYGPFTVAQALKRLELGPRCRRNSNCFAFFHFSGVRASRAYRAAWGGVERKQRPERRKKNKKKVRHPGLESGESAWKAEVLPLHQWRARSTDGCAATRAGVGCFLDTSTMQAKKPHGFCARMPRVHATLQSFFIVHYLNINGDDHLLTADCTLRTCVPA